MYVNDEKINLNECASLWLQQYSDVLDVPKNWRQEAVSWFWKWSEENNAQFGYEGEPFSDERMIEQQKSNYVTQNIEDDIKKNFKTNISKKRIYRKFNRYKNTPEYDAEVEERKKNSPKYQLLCSESYKDSKEFENYKKCYINNRKKHLEKDFVKSMKEQLELRMKEKDLEFLEIQRINLEKAYGVNLEKTLDKKRLEFLKTIDVKEVFFNLHMEDIIIKNIETYLATEQILDIDNNLCRDPYEWYDPFENNYDNNKPDTRYITLLENLMENLSTDVEEVYDFTEGYYDFIGYAVDILSRGTSTLSRYIQLSSAFRDCLFEFLNEECDVYYPFCDILHEKIEETFTKDYLIDCLSKNPLYISIREILKEEEQKEEREKMEQERIRQCILERIPERYEDSYPLARRMKRHFVLHIGPTNSGKTYESMKAFREAKTAIYLAPLRLLAYEKYEESNKLNCPCNMITGEEELFIEHATHESSTIEMLDFTKYYDVCVIDEAQMLADKDRGNAWTSAILGVQATTIYVCAAEYAEKILIQLIKICGDTYEIVKHERFVPLVCQEEPFIFPESVKEHDALIVFSKANVMKVAAELQRKNFKVSVIYGALPYESRQREVERFVNRETQVVVATDAIGLGMNLPIERILFLETKKFDGEKVRELNESEIKQIAGRAGRRGIYDIGYYTSAYNQKMITTKFNEPSKEVKSVLIDFPETLLTINGKISELLEQWKQIQLRNEALFRKQNVDNKHKLAIELEKYSDNKRLIYEFITISFDETNDEFKYIWKKVFIYLETHKDLSFSINNYLRYFNAPNKLKHLQLDELELEYKKSDLLYNFFRKKFSIFSCSDSEIKIDNNLKKKQIMEYKKIIAEQISSYLATQSLPSKRCKKCHCSLSWNFPYSYCESCYNEMNYKRNRYWDDDDDYY